MALALSFLRDHVSEVRALADRLADANRLLDHEALAVGRLQRELLPGALPRVPGYEWSVHYETCTRAGGDYYDFTALADGRVGILIADASGHGAPAAVLMAMTRDPAAHGDGALHGARSRPDPAEPGDGEAPARPGGS